MSILEGKLLIQSINSQCALPSYFLDRCISKLRGVMLHFISYHCLSHIFTFFVLMQTVKALIRPHILGHHICFVNHRLQCCNILVSSNQALLFSQSFRINKMLQKDLNNAIFKCFQNDMIGKVKKYVSVHMKIAY